MHLQIEPNTLLIFLDETGHEGLLDKNYPVFGIGGCAMMGCDYGDLIRTPWINIKTNAFGSAVINLHAADLKKPTIKQLAAFNDFFSTKYFSRFASLLKTTTSHSVEIERYNLLYHSTLNRIEEISRAYPLFTSITLIFEHSSRTQELVQNHFSNFDFKINNKSIPVLKYFMAKTLGEPGLEVADFIVHTAGCHVRNTMQRKLGRRKDFQCIFTNMDKKYTSFFDIDSATFTKDQRNVRQ